MKSARGQQKHWVITAALALALFVFSVTCTDAATIDNGLPDGYKPTIYNAIPAQQFKDVFETETIEVSGISVVCEGGFANPFTDTVHFRVFNSTTQETEYEVDTVNDGISQTLPPLELKKNHNYIFFAEDPNYQLGTKKYVQILDEGAKMANEGAGAYDYKYIVTNSAGEEQYNKEYKKLTQIRVFRRSEVSENPREDARCCIGCTDLPVVVKYKGEPVTEKLKFRFVSDIEERRGQTNYLTEGQGILYANLLEDITYMVYLDSDKYVMDPFPIVVKDKSEYGEGRYAYNHTTCFRVDENNPINLFDPGKTDFDDQYDSMPVVTSLKGRVTVSGMSFRHLLILDRELDSSIAPGMDGKDCDVFDVTAVNPHRWEISKIAGKQFTVTKKIEHNKLAAHVYYIGGDDTLQELPFTQNSADEVSFSTDSLSLYPYVIEFDPDRTYEQIKSEEQAAREEAERRAAAEAAEKQRIAQEAAWNGSFDGSLPKLKISKPKAAKKGFTAKWKKLSKKQLKKAGGISIEVQYSLNGAFPMQQTDSKTVGKKKTSLKIKSLAPKQTYYVRVRTVRDSGGTRYVSAWSKVKKVKTK